MSDQNKTVKNPGLVMAIRVMKQEFTSENQERVVREILKAKFLAPVRLEVMPFKVGSDRTSLTERSRMKFLSIHNGAGERFFPAFTDEKELEKFEMERDQQVSYLSFEDYVQLMADDRAAGGFVINPYGENLVCDRKTVASWMKHMKEIKTGVSLEEEPRIRLGRPKEMPAQLIQAVSEYLKEQDRVRAAYLSLIQPEGGKTGYLIVVDMEGNADTVFDKIAEACAPHLKGMPLAVEPLASELGQAAAKDREPFYLAQR